MSHIVPDAVSLLGCAASTNRIIADSIERYGMGEIARILRADAERYEAAIANATAAWLERNSK